MKKFFWVLFALCSVGIGLYPALYLLRGFAENGLLSTKSPELLESIWLVGFYLHIIPGGLALLIGWPQFSKRLRGRNIGLHRLVGKAYLLAVGVSGLAGLYLSFHATGGLIAQLGFGILAVAWLATSWLGWRAVIDGHIERHRNWMIRSYALCFAAVTLRIWLPTFLISGWPFEQAYVIIAWLCWVPNLIFAESLILIRKKKNALAL